MNRRALLVCLIIISLTAVACGDEEKDQAPPPHISITYQPQPNATVLPGCKTGDLESWNEVAGTLIYTFDQESLAAVELQPFQMTNVIQRLIDLRDTIAAYPTPECATQTHAEILLTIRGMLTAFQRYANGDITQDDLREQINGAHDQINTRITELLATTQADLEARLEQERGAPQQ